MFSIYDLFVNDVFGGFWLSTIGLSFIFSMMLLFGGVSSFSMLIFVGIFLLAMSMGYGVSLISVLIFFMSLSWAALEILRYFEER